jgi:hypothetical protein
MTYDNSEKSPRDVKDPGLEGPEPSDRRRLDIPRGSRSFKGMLIAAAVLVGVLVLLSFFSLGTEREPGATVNDGDTANATSSADTSAGDLDATTEADPSD